MCPSASGRTTKLLVNGVRFAEAVRKRAILVLMRSLTVVSVSIGILAALNACADDDAPDAAGAPLESSARVQFLLDDWVERDVLLESPWNGEEELPPVRVPIARLEPEGEDAFRIPVPLKRDPRGQPRIAPAWTHSGGVEHAVLFRGREVHRFATLPEFAGFPAPPDAHGNRRTLIRRSDKVTFTVPAHPFQRRARLVATEPPGFRRSSEFPAELPAVRVRLAGEEMARVALSERPTPLVAEFDLPPSSSTDWTFELEFEHCTGEGATGEFALVEFHVESADGLDRVLAPDFATEGLVVQPAVPRPLQLLQRASDPPRAEHRVRIVRVGAKCELRVVPPSPVSVRAGQRTLASSERPISALTVPLPDEGWSDLVIEFPAAHRGTVALLQPVAAFVAGGAAVRSVESPVTPAVIRPVTSGTTTFRSLLLPAGSRFECSAQPTPSSRLEWEVCVIDPRGAPTRTGALELIVHAGEQVLEQVSIPPGQTWQRFRHPCPKESGELRLRVEVRAGGTAPMVEPLLLLAFAEPRVVPALDLRSPRSTASGEANPPNVLVYLVDTLRADRLSCYGHERETSPHLDALAADGVLFEHVVAQAPWTKPSVASVFTGLLQSFHGAGKDYSLSPAAETLAEVLHDAGLHTAAFVANPYVYLSGLQFEQGFSEFHAVQPPGRAPLAGDVTDAALNWLDRHGDRPFFLYLHTLDPHEPYDPPPATRGAFGSDRSGPLSPDQTFAKTLRRGGPIDAEGVQWLLDLYDEEILYNDQQFGRLIAGLKERGIYENTTIVFLSDHGELFSEHGNYGHGVALWQELLHVPLVIKEARTDRQRGLRITERVDTLGLLPTLACQVGASWDSSRVQGEDLTPRLRGEGGPGLDCIAENEPDQVAFVRDDWKLLQDGPDESPARSLFHLKSDAREVDDRAAVESEQLEALSSALSARLERDRARGLECRADRTQLSADQIARLQALGYLADEGEDAGAARPEGIGPEELPESGDRGAESVRDELP